jgi:hypothetical protein
MSIKIVPRVYDPSVSISGIREANPGERPDFWTVFKFVEEGIISGWKHLVDCPTRIEAVEYATTM